MAENKKMLIILVSMWDKSSHGYQECKMKLFWKTIWHREENILDKCLMVHTMEYYSVIRQTKSQTKLLLHTIM